MYDLILKNVSRYITLGEHEIDFLKSVLKVRKIRKRQYLIQADEVCHHEHFVIKGCLRAYAVDRDGQEHIIMFAIEDWWISDLASFLTGKPATFNIDALEDTEVLCIEKSDRERLFEKVPKFERFFRIIFENAFIAQQDRILANISQSAEVRYRSFVQKYPGFERRIPQHQIASFLGLTPETLSRIRRQQAGK